MAGGERLESYLRQQQVSFQVQEHHPAVTAREVAAPEHPPGRLVAKAVVTLADGQMILPVLPASTRSTSRGPTYALSVRASRRAYEAEFVDTFADCEVGALAPCMSPRDI